MAFASLKGGALWPDPHLDPEFGVNTVANTFSDFLLDGASDKLAFIFQAPKTGNIDRGIFRVGALTASGDIDLRLETVDLATGAPSGTLVAASTNVTVTTSAADTTLTGTFTAVAPVVRGTYYALVLSWISGNRGIKRINQAATSRNKITGWQRRISYVREGPTGTYDGQTGNPHTMAPVFGVRYDDATYEWIPGNVPISAYAKSAFNNTSAARERGMWFIPPVPMRPFGAFYAGQPANANFDLILAQTNGTAIATASIDKDLGTTYATGTNYGGQGAILFPAPAAPTDHDLVAGTKYYLTLKPTSATDITLFDVDVLDTAVAATMGLFNGGVDVGLVTRDSGGVYTESTTKRPFSMGLIISQLSDGTGGSGGDPVPCSRPVIMW